MAEEKKERSGGLSLQTLLISAAAAVVAASVVPMVWQQGTLIATAMTPVIVALVSEGLRKPVERVSTVAPRVARRSGTGAALRRSDPDAARTRDPRRLGARGEGPERFEPLTPDRRDDVPTARADDPYGLREAPRRRLRLRIALVTGALAFFAAAAVVTASELALFGGSVSGERGRTTLFGGDERSSSRDSDRSGQEERDATPTATPEGEATPEPTPTPTPTPEATAIPSPTPTPVPTEAAPTPAPTP